MASGKNEPVFSCRAYPDFCRTGKRGQYFDVRVFASIEDLRKATGAVDAAACFDGFDHHRLGNRTRKIGVLSFYYPKIGAGIVSHEATHAALYWASKNGLDDEELVALAVGEIVRQVFSALAEVNYLNL